jgi:hypothetical protein
MVFFEGRGCSQTSRSCTRPLSAAGACGTASARCTSTLFSDEAEEMPKPETWSFLAEDAEELPACCHLREKPGGCDAEDAMAGREGKEREREGAGDQGVAGEGRRGGGSTHLPTSGTPTSRTWSQDLFQFSTQPLVVSYILRCC